MEWIVAFVAGTGSGLLTGLVAHALSSRRDRKQQVRASYRRYVRLRYPLKQAVVSRFEALIYSNYHERLWNLSGSPTVSLDLDEAKRWMLASELGVAEISKVVSQVDAECAMLALYFLDKQEIQQLVKELRGAPKNFNIKMFTQGTKEDLDAAKTKSVDDLQILVDHEIGERFDAIEEAIRDALFREMNFKKFTQLLMKEP